MPAEALADVEVPAAQKADEVYCIAKGMREVPRPVNKVGQQLQEGKRGSRRPNSQGATTVDARSRVQVLMRMPKAKQTPPGGNKSS